MSATTQCGVCVYYEGLMTCKAFPDGIPHQIMAGEFDHNKPWPDKGNRADNGVTFKDAEKATR